MLKAITFDFWQTLYADSEENWQRRQAIRTKSAMRIWIVRVIRAVR